jgi:hypothetical protein
MPNPLDHQTKKHARVSATASSRNTETADLSHISDEITPVAMTAPDPPSSYWLSPSPHRYRAAQLRAKNPKSRAATLAEMAAHAIENRLRDGKRRKE